VAEVEVLKIMGLEALEVLAGEVQEILAVEELLLLMEPMG